MKKCAPQITGKRLINLYYSNINTCHLLFLIIFITLIYSRVYRFDFVVGWDDQWFVFNHYTEDGFNFKNLSNILTDFYYGQYAPVNQLYYTFLYYFFKYDPKYYHITSVIIHMINIILVYFLSKRLSKTFSVSDEVKSAQIGFITALSFGILPINLEPVAWIAASKVTLYALFYLLAIHCYCNYIKNQKPLYYYLTIVFFTLSFGAKEQAVTLSVCLILLDFIFKRPLKEWMIWYEKIPFFILSIFFGMITLQSQGSEVLENTKFYTIDERIILSFYTFSEYLIKTLLPVNLSYLYPFPFQVGQSMPIWLWLHAITIPTVLFLMFKHIKNWFLFGFLFFSIHIILVINLLSLARFSIIADRYTYLATFGTSFMIGYFIIVHLNHSKYKKTAYTALLIYFSYLAVYTNEHSKVWSNVNTLKEKLRMEIKNKEEYKIWKTQIMQK